MACTMHQRFIKCRGGNFGIMTAAILPVVIATAGVAIDVTRAMDEKYNLQALADAATLTGASAFSKSSDMTAEEVEKLAENVLIAQKRAEILASGMSDEEKKKAIAALEENTNATVEAASGSASVAVHLKTSYDMPLNPFTGLIGFKTMRISVDSRSVSSQKAAGISMFLVLDESGSMAEKINSRYTRMDALKSAAYHMVQELKKADPDQNNIRMGAQSYNHKARQPQSISWDLGATQRYALNLPKKPTGGTDAYDSLRHAITVLENSGERSTHWSAGNETYERYVILMTDGEMTGDSSNWSRRLDHRIRNLCSWAKSNYPLKIYSVALAAPARGRRLLRYCASDGPYYYAPETMEALVESFGDIARKFTHSNTRVTH